MGVKRISDWIDILKEVYRDYSIENPSDNELRGWICGKTTVAFGTVATNRGIKNGSTVNSNTIRNTGLDDKEDLDDLIYKWLITKNENDVKTHLLNNVHKGSKEKALVDEQNIEEFFNTHKL